MSDPWVQYALKDVARIEGGGTPSRSEPAYFGGSIPWVTPTDLKPIGFLTENFSTRDTLTPAGLANSSAKLIPKGSVLFSSRATIGKIAITSTACATNQGFANFVPDPARITSEFLALLLLRYRGEIKKLAGKTTFLEVPRGKLREFKIKLPLLPEQRRIVARIRECTDRVEEIERLRDETIRESEFLVPSIYESIEEQDKFPLKTVHEVTVSTRNGRSISRDNANATGFVLSLSSVREVDLDLASRKPIQLPQEIARQFRIEEGDVFVSRSNTRELVGLSSVSNASPENLIYPDLLIKLKVNEALMRPRFLAYALRTASGRKQIQERAVGTSQSMVKISAERLKEVRIKVPSLKDQDDLLNTLEDCQRLALSLKAEIQVNDSAYLRDAILRKAFAGDL
jgi:type I restriction enzyme, S subunit